MKFTYERRDYDKMDLSQEPALKIEDKAIEDKEVTPNNIMRMDDRRVLIDFIGEKDYNYIFENPV